MSFGERKPRSAEAELRALLLAQHGLITAAQALSAGISAAAVSRRVAGGRWLHVLPGVYRDVLMPESLEQSALAALLWGGSDAVICFAGAGTLWALDGLDTNRMHLWTPRRLRSDLVVVHRGEVALNDRRRLGPITLTSPARTIIDLAGVLEDEDLTAIVEDAIHRGLTTPMSIRRCLEALGGRGRPGTARLRAILDDRGNQRPTMSRLEVKIWRTLRAKGLTPVRQHPVRCGNTTYHLDCAFPQWRVSVEGFGDKFHRSPRVRKRELRRLADLASVHWRVLPVTWDDITAAPDDVIAKIVTTLAA
jgi:very-short-patch-repair endonuclease